MSLNLVLEAPDLAVIRASETLLRAEVDAMKKRVAAHILANGKVHLLFIIDPGFSNLEAFASWDDIEADKIIQPNVIRVAIVGDLRWRDKALVFFITAVASFQIEYFPAEQEEFARAWLLA
jgi:SpoIIAA-like